MKKLVIIATSNAMLEALLRADEDVTVVGPEDAIPKDAVDSVHIIEDCNARCHKELLD